MSESQEPKVTMSWGIDHYAALAGLTPAPVVEEIPEVEETPEVEEVPVVEESDVE
jgi:hypothetical protein